MRRKGEKRIVHEPITWSEQCPIARSIRTGSGWLDAWIGQQNVDLDLLSRRSKVPRERLVQLLFSSDVTDAELQAMAGPFRTDPATMRASIGYAMAQRGADPHGL